MGSGFNGIWVADVNRDGHGDILSVARLRTGTSTGDVQTALVVLFTHGNGTFDRADVDLAKTDAFSASVTAVGHLRPAAADGVDVLVQGLTQHLVQLDGKGAQTGVLSMPLKDAKRGVFLDLDGDGQDELLADGGLSAEGFGAFRRESGGWAAVPVPMWESVPAGQRPAFSATSVLLGDIDGNGRIDYIDEAQIALAGDGATYLIRSRADQGATETFDLLQDLDDDGNADLERSSALLGDGQGAFTPGSLPATLSGAVLVHYAYADVDGDGILDAVQHLPKAILCARGVGGVVLK